MYNFMYLCMYYVNMILPEQQMYVCMYVDVYMHVSMYIYVYVNMYMHVCM